MYRKDNDFFYNVKLLLPRYIFLVFYRFILND